MKTSHSEKRSPNEHALNGNAERATDYSVRFVLRDGVVYSMVNATDIPPLPVFHQFDTEDTGLPDIKVFRRREFRYDNDFYLALVPEDPQFSRDPLLRHLDYSQYSYPVEGSHGVYAMSPSIQEKWVLLENVLASVASTLQKAVFAAQPLYLSVYWPRYYGYQKKFSTSRAAQRAAWKSREAFIAVFAYIKFLICKFNTSVLGKTSSWDLYLAAKQYPISVIELLRGWMDNGRPVGAFVYPYKSGSWVSQWIRDLPCLMSSKVAFWLPFGDVETVPEDALKLPKALIPSPSHIHALRYPPPAYEPPPLPSGPAPSEEDLEITRRLRLEALEKYPEPHPMSYQNRGEFCQDFMKRRAAAHAKFLKVESAREKDTREKQKLMYDGPSGQRMPSTDSSVKIFYWEPVEGVEGYRSRTCIDKSQWEVYWRNRNGQRLYDEFYNEFDISSEFGDDADRWDDVDAEGASVHDSASEADDDADVLDMGSSTPEPGEVVEELGANTSMSDSAKALSVLMNIANVTESNAREAPVPDSVEDVLSYLHSLHTDSFPDEAGKALLAPSLAMTILGLTRARPDPALYPLLQRYTTNPERKPTALDVERVRRSGARLKIIAKAYSEHVWDVFGVCQGPCYIIESDEPGDVEWSLTVDEATIVLLIIRRGWGPHIRDIATELLKRGIVFHTYRTRPLHALDEELRHHTYISWRNVSLGYHCGSEGLAVDFCSYVNVRNRFLRETHACRAALLHGGITWRIAMDALGYEYASGQVLAGPGRDCVEFGAMPQFLSDGTELWDDVLSPQELDLICGVYKADPDNMQDISWWPRPNVWRSGGLDVGYWAIDCETWYVARRAAILVNNEKLGKLRNMAQWRNSLKFARRRTKEVWNVTRAFSEVLLQQLVATP